MNVDAKTSNEITNEAVNTVKSNMAKEKITSHKINHGDKQVGQPCEYKWWTRDTECAEKLKCSKAGTCINAKTGHGKKELGETCTHISLSTTSECEVGLKCASFDLCVDSNGNGNKILNDACEHHLIDSECQADLRCSSTIKKCVATKEFAKTLRNAIKNLLESKSNEDALTAELTESKGKKEDLAATAKADAPDTTKKNFFKGILDKLKNFKTAVKDKLTSTFHLVDDWVKVIAVGLEAKGTFTVFTGSASINYAWVRGGEENYFYTETCTGFQANFGVSGEVGVIINILHEAIEEGGKEKSKEIGIALEIEVEVIPIKFSVEVSMSFKKTGSNYEMDGISLGLGAGVGVSIIPVTVSGLSCTARRLS